jgi:hypothetical protein
MSKIKSALSKVVAQQIGELEGQLKAYALTKLTEYANQLKDSCPPLTESLTIAKTVDSIQSILIKYQKQFQKYNSLISKLDKVIESTTLAVTILRTLPVPTAIAGVGVPIGLTNRYSEKLIQLSEFLENLNNDKRAIISILQSGNIDISGIQSRINTVKGLVNKCIQESTKAGDFDSTTSNSLNNLNRQLQDSNTLLEIGDKDLYSLSDGRQVRIEIKTIEDPSYPVNRRFAEAKNLNGGILLVGDPSYSPDTNTLIEETLFKLENSTGNSIVRSIAEQEDLITPGISRDLSRANISIFNKVTIKFIFINAMLNISIPS